MKKRRMTKAEEDADDQGVQRDPYPRAEEEEGGGARLPLPPEGDGEEVGEDGGRAAAREQEAEQ